MISDHKIKNLGVLVRDFRKKKNITQQYLHEKTGICKSQISQFETGKELLSLKPFCSLCNVLGTSPNYLLGYESKTDDTTNQENSYFGISQLGTRLHTFRNNAELTFKELTEITRISQPQLCRFERGKQTPSLQNLCILCDALGITPNDILIINIKS